MKIAVVGTGYVGLTMAVLLSQKHEVFAVDILKEKVDKINQKISPIKDDYLEDYLKNKDLNLIATLDCEIAFKNADYVVIATPTNYDSSLNYFDTKSIETVVNNVETINPKATIVIKSTIPIGYTKRICEMHPNLSIIFSPEFLRESKALYDNLYPSRIIIGADLANNELMEKAKAFGDMLQSCALKPNIPILYMNYTEAEAVKLFANTYLALRVAYFNELDTFAELKDLDTKSIIEGVCLDERIGNFYNNPSFGYGGYCLPKDTKQLKANYSGVPEKLISAIIDANDVRKKFIASQILKKAQDYANKDKNQPDNDKLTIGVYRLTMKSKSDNFRQAAILEIIDILKNNGANIIIYEPTYTDDKFLDYAVVKNLNDFKEKSDIIITNRFEEDLADVKHKLYTRDIFKRD